MRGLRLPAAMKISSDRLAPRLESELGARAVTTDSVRTAAHKIDGSEPALVCLPETPEQIAAALRICFDADAAVSVWGGGTAARTGNHPTRLDVIISAKGLNRLIEHDHANLTATVEAGMPVALLQESLGTHKQFAALDPPFATQATLGGVLAVNLNGPRRVSYGSVRDLVIGLKAVLASGEQIKAGGKVVKNVAGYDICKLFVGSLGTLGVISEVTLRLAPLPESAATLMVWGALPQLLSFIGDLRRSVLLPAAMVVLNSSGDSRSAWAAAIWCEGFHESVERHLKDASSASQRLGLANETLRDDRHQQLWRRICDAPLDPGRSTIRVMVPVGSVARMLQMIEAWRAGDSPIQVIADAHAGTLWLSVDSSTAATRCFKTALPLATEQHGHAVLFAAPPSAKESIDVWGHLPSSFPIMREIKRQLDPKGLLNPGRFVGGI
jgi:glycolate oxidase FAD binding subunit